MSYLTLYTENDLTIKNSLNSKKKKIIQKLQKNCL